MPDVFHFTRELSHVLLCHIIIELFVKSLAEIIYVEWIIIHQTVTPHSGFLNLECYCVNLAIQGE
jgi:hypothetical protein